MKSFFTSILAILSVEGIAVLASPVASTNSLAETSANDRLFTRQLTAGNIFDLFDALDDGTKEECDNNVDNTCTCASPNELYRVINGADGQFWGRSVCPGNCPDGDPAIGNRPDHPAVIPTGPDGNAHGECGIHLTVYRASTTPDEDHRIPIDHFQVEVKDANTNVIDTIVVPGSWAADTSGSGYNLIYLGGNFVNFEANTGTFRYAGQDTSLDQSKTIPGVHPCSAGAFDENGVSEADCGFHCLMNGF